MSEMDERELQAWRHDWRTDADRPPPIPAELRQIVARGRRRLIGTLVLESLVVLGGVLGVILVLRRRADALTLVWGATVVVLFAGAIAFTWRNRRGLLDPEGETCEKYLALARARCASHLRSVRFAYWLLAVEVAFLVVWGGFELASRRTAMAADPAPYLVRWALTVLAIIGALAWARVAKQRAQRQSDALARLADELSS